MADQDRLKAEEMAREFSTPARKLRVVQQGTKIIDPLLFSKENYTHRFNELRLLSKMRQFIQESIQAEKLISPEEAIKNACMELGLDEVWADKFLGSPRYARWAEDRIKEIQDHLEISVPYLASKHRDNLEGTIKLTSSQLESAKELGDRFWPKTSRIEHQIEQKNSNTLDDLPDYQKKVEDLEKQMKDSINSETVMHGGMESGAD